VPGRGSDDTVDHLREHVHNDGAASVRGGSAHADGRRRQAGHNGGAHPDQGRRKGSHLGGVHSDRRGRRRPTGRRSGRSGGSGRDGGGANNDGQRRHSVFQAAGRQDSRGRRDGQAADVRRQRGRETDAQARRVFGRCGDGGRETTCRGAGADASHSDGRRRRPQRPESYHANGSRGRPG